MVHGSRFMVNALIRIADNKTTNKNVIKNYVKIG